MRAGATKALLLFLLAATPLAWAETLPFGVSLKPGEIKRVLFLGDSITYGGLYTAYVETFLTLRYRDQSTTFINCGLSSETVSGLSEPGHAGGVFPRPALSERLERVLTQVKPDLVFACYGMNDGLFQPEDDQRFQAFQNGMRALRQAVAAHGVRLIHMTPPVYDDVTGQHPYYPKVLEREASWLLSQRSEGWNVIDIFGPMSAFLTEQRKADPAFRLAQDGVHPGALGHWVIGREILASLGYNEVRQYAEANALASAFANGPQVLKSVTEREELLRNAWLTATRYHRPGIPVGLPLPEAEAAARQIGAKIAELIQTPVSAAAN